MVGLGTLVCVIEVHECLFRIAGDHDLEKFPNMTIRSCRKKHNWICPRFRYNEWPLIGSGSFAWLVGAACWLESSLVLLVFLVGASGLVGACAWYVGTFIGCLTA